MTDAQILMLRHTVGADDRQPGYRNRYCTEETNPDALALVELGFFKGPQYVGQMGGSTSLFFATKKAFDLLGIKEKE